MKIPLGWLREYVEIDAAAEEIAERLTFTGMEVESISVSGPDGRDLVAGEILSVAPHPRAERLRVCGVADGSESLQVVCGADNFAVGDKVALARVGARLPDGTHIRSARLRGVESRGMLCAEDELGLSDDHTGILLLPQETRAGTPLCDVLGPPDTVLELEITWNRPDCLSVIGVAREVAAIYGAALRIPAFTLPAAEGPVSSWTSVAVEDPAGCPRYSARVLLDVQTAPSPLWMRRRLMMCGVRPISNLVDVTNYVMLECGQPLHAFDYDLLQEHRIVVRRARAGETLSTLDGKERAIDPRMLMIADAARPVAVAGIMGGAGSEIRETTRRVLLESACFNPADIHRTCRSLALSTESSRRFERGVDIDRVEWAGRRACALMVELAGARPVSGVIDRYPCPRVPRRIACRAQRVRELLGMQVDVREMTRIFGALGLAVVAESEASCTVQTPGFRPDLEIEADLIEEVARMRGLDRIPDVDPDARVVTDARDDETRARSACRSCLVALGLTEIMNYSFLSESRLDLFGLDEKAERVVLPNPVSAEHGVLRSSLIPQMVETLGRNRAHQTPRAALFEMGRVFVKGSGSIHERERLCVGLTGAAGAFQIETRGDIRPERMFFWLKGIVERLAAVLKAGELAFEKAPVDCLEPGCSLVLRIGDAPVGRLGLLCESLRRGWRLSDPVGLAELDTAPFLAHVFDVPAPQPVSVYPAVSRDVSLLVGRGVTHHDIVDTVRKAAPEELTEVELFDIFEDRELGDDRRCMAYSLTYRSPKRSLTDEEANGYHESIKDALKRALDIEVR